ncbi:MAG: HesA/MoeB/ThiF family protein, partial [Calditrichaeota bacterium]|nr:HesA/MoeB/ThiF family protein [Calditrichota bacterium]
MDFSTRELERYSRHLSLPEFGIEGQRALKRGSVLLVGAGGLGSPAALYLAAAGVGRIGIVESDTVELSNLQRQVLYTSEQCGQSKARLAAERLRALNPEIEVVVHEQRLEAANALELMT